MNWHDWYSVGRDGMPKPSDYPVLYCLPGMEGQYVIYPWKPIPSSPDGWWQKIVPPPLTNKP